MVTSLYAHVAVMILCVMLVNTHTHTHTHTLYYSRCTMCSASRAKNHRHSDMNRPPKTLVILTAVYVSFVPCMLSYSIFWSQTSSKLTYLLT